MASNHYRASNALNEVPFFLKMMGLTESGPAALSGSKDLTAHDVLLCLLFYYYVYDVFIYFVFMYILDF